MSHSEKVFQAMTKKERASYYQEVLQLFKAMGGSEWLLKKKLRKKKQKF